MGALQSLTPAVLPASFSLSIRRCRCDSNSYRIEYWALLLAPGEARPAWDLCVMVTRAAMYGIAPRRKRPGECDYLFLGQREAEGK